MDYAVNVDPEMLATMTAQQAPMPTAQAPAQPAPQLSAAAQSFLDRVDAYEQQKRDEGYLVRRGNIVGPDGDMNAAYENLAAQLDKGLSPADLQVTELGHAFKTNKGKPAKTKANPTGEIYAAPGTKYRLTNEQGQNAILVEGEGQAALDEIYALASNLSTTEKKKADWKVEVYEPGNDKWRPLADDDPPGDVLGTIAKIGLPIAGALLAGPLGLGGALGIGGVGAAAAGAALGSVAGGTIAGDSIGDILKGAALSGGLTFAGGSALGGLGGGSGGAAGAAGGAGGAAGSAAGSAAAGGLGAAGEIVVQGIRQLPAAIAGGAGAIGSAGAALANGAGGSGGNGPTTAQPNGALPTDIVVTGAPTTPPLDPGVLAGGAGVIGGGSALGAGGGGNLTTDASGVTTDPNTITAVGQPSAPPLDPGVLAGGAGAGAGLATGADGVTIDPNTITATGQPSAITNLDPGVLAGLGLTAAQIAALTAGMNPVTQPPGGNGTLSDIVDYLQAAGLLSGFLGDLFGGGGGGGKAKIPAGWGSTGLGGVFTKPLPTASLPGVSGRTTRLMPPQDWTKYAMRPEQSFWSNVAETYTPPPPGQYDLWGN